MTKHSGSEDNEIREIENWRNEHGEPDFEYLASLSADGSTEALEKLKYIALDLDVDFDPDTSIPELIDRIRAATQKNEDGNPVDTN